MKKVLLFVSLFLTTFTLSYAQNQPITETGGWFESAWVKWTPIDSAQSYEVFYSGEGIVDKQIDNQLIRDYGTYFRADVLGLVAGDYSLKIVPKFENSIGDTTVSESITVMAHDRTGFAFSNGRVPGAYKADGTLKSGAVVLYITENTKNTISMNVTGANENPCVGLQNILLGYKKGGETRPLIVRMIGQITDFDVMDKGDIVVENDNNASSYITIEGVGDDAVADGWGIRLKNSSNIEIRNIATMNCNSDEGDNIGLQQNNDYIWIHHCDFFYGDAGSDSDQAKGDGALDCKKSTYVTFSYNHFWDSGKSNLLGLSEDESKDWYITYHHNWYDHSDSRHPRVRIYSAHVYNNYYDGNSKYGVGSTMGSSVFVEANYFRNCKYPILISMQGSDVYDEDESANDYSDMPTFSKEDGGIIKAYNNTMITPRRFVPYGAAGYPSSTVDFDAYVADSADEIVPASVVSAYGSNTYNNFDTDESIMYDYTPDSPADAKTNVMAYAGRINGGDFTWTFTNSTDDTSYDVDTELKSALTNYATSLVAIQGDSSGIGEVDTTDPGTGNDTTGTGGEVVDGDEIHNFTLSGLTSTFYTISGNLSDSKGTVTYGDLTLTQCLKIESSTNISFTITEEAVLTLVFNEGESEDIKVDGTSYSITNGVLTLTLQSGTHTITKDNTVNLYYMSIAYTSSSEEEETVLSSLEKVAFTVYPNPADDFINIYANTQINSVDFYSVSGVRVKSVPGNTNSIDISVLTSGMYLMMIYTTEGISNQTIIKR